MGIYTCELLAVVDETPTVRTIRLRRPADLDFVPGQFCLISFVGESDFVGVKKPFTFSSSPTTAETFDLTIKKMEGFTTALFSLDVGQELLIEGPYGELLNFDGSSKKDLVLIAGGSGVAPFMSFIDFVVDKKLTNKVLLFNSNRTAGEIIFRDRLAKVAEMNKNVDVVTLLTREKTCTGKDVCGRIDVELLKKYIGDLSNKEWYVCGPTSLVRGLRDVILEIGVAPNDIHYEVWQLPGKSDLEVEK
ncbi:hypothetical protein HN419_06520 [Candidatus Woesearchaeota archaeon]|jgi:ferredoxin-NADP reductase|nr:hypothetical protein [Candidatus Woesearchaeota archaeon]MBT3538149.1 hypothetical protein [Candidatus Woesearchaeota archaeon]MBT4716864.1 hypothetical protein [Candidatus Woesearchaeota archaeon]MBT7105818.1 hypothetical protein [Candidatus Woesearchaeota archaeon]MBT7930655.1 hypothetical protein [Candidatus Woesearchaeota archaeon]